MAGLVFHLATLHWWIAVDGVCIVRSPLFSFYIWVLVFGKPSAKLRRCFDRSLYFPVDRIWVYYIYTNLPALSCLQVWLYVIILHYMYELNVDALCFMYIHRYGAPLIEYVLLSYLHVAVGVAILSHPIMERRMSLPLLQAAKTKQWAMATTFLWELELQAQGNSK